MLTNLIRVEFDGRVIQAPWQLYVSGAVGPRSCDRPSWSGCFVDNRASAAYRITGRRSKITIVAKVSQGRRDKVGSPSPDLEDGSQRDVLLSLSGAR